MGGEFSNQFTASRRPAPASRVLVVLLVVLSVVTVSILLALYRYVMGVSWMCHGCVMGGHEYVMGMVLLVVLSEVTVYILLALLAVYRYIMGVSWVCHRYVMGV